MPMVPIQNLNPQIDEFSSRLLSTTSCSDHSSSSAAAAPPRQSPPSSSSSEMWNYIWIPFLISLWKDISVAKATETPAAILLPSQLGGEDDSRAVDLRSHVCPSLNPNLNYQPVIGILSHPGDGASGRLNNATNASYIAASYVKLAEAGGARVIPLIYNEPEEVLFQKLELVNGVIFTGGWAKRGLYYETVKKIFNKALERNDAGEHFPVYAICLGFELLSMIISQDRNILEEFAAEDAASTLQFVENINIEGTVFQRFPPQLLRKLSTDCLVMQNHRYGISPERLLGNPALSSFFNILTTCIDEHDKTYVSTVQSKRYPVTGFQWHPEKNAFEWGSSKIPHSEDAIQVTQHAANYLVSEARKSLNRPPSQKVLENLIYNYSPTYCGYAGRGFDEVYIFTQQRSHI
ncbi:PREDICTED: gamma-glutamyl hydrolase 2-like [Tarenaya hassleriana]|uniref:gamma-glutamyl hydrolase 2-like n=1 Tax=Tarenaya hassleriana TaxID=28532 RepID=UPI00053CA69C|nr:PREDICTED: gamma-glutamyl hydrolase 2-like [Tarenaya hassleriana]